jgi:Domain of unknown function (DUF4262)
MLNKIEQNIVDHVDRVGWSIMSVAPRADSDGPKDWFSYTIGLPKTLGWPELICFGLDTRLAHGLLNDAVAQLRDDGLTPAHGLLLPKVIKGDDVRFIDADRIPLSYFNSARWFAEYSGFVGALVRLQMLWPDDLGVFPDDPRCEESVRSAQTPLELLQ